MNSTQAKRTSTVVIVAGLVAALSSLASGAAVAQSTMCKNGYADWANRSLDPKGIHPTLRCEPVGRPSAAQAYGSNAATQAAMMAAAKQQQQAKLAMMAAAKQQQQAKLAMMAEQRRLAAATPTQPTKLQPQKASAASISDADNPDKQTVGALPSGRCRNYLPSTGQVVEVPCS